MRILFMVGLSLVLPTVCFAHTGSVFSAVSSYLPFLAPLAVGAAAVVHRFSHRIKDYFKKK